MTRQSETLNREQLKKALWVIRMGEPVTKASKPPCVEVHDPGLGVVIQTVHTCMCVQWSSCTNPSGISTN